MVKRKGVPDWGELVICEVKNITPYAAWVKLIEYPDAEGMIHVSEVAGKWVHDIRDFIKPNKQYVAKVVKIDYQKNFVNLSIKRVSKRDEKEKQNSFRREQRAEKILEQVAVALKKNLDQAYEEVGYLLQERFGELSDAIEEVRKDRSILMKNAISEKWNNALINVISKSFQEKEIKIKVRLEIKSLESDGVKRIKKILTDLGDKTGATIKYISAPRYLIELKTKNPKADEKKLVEALNNAIQDIRKGRGEGKYELIR